MELIECIEKLEKSKIKAGDGEKEGKYPLYTCSPKVNKFFDNYLYDTEAIILSTGGNPVINYHKGEFSYSTDCLAIKSNGEFENKYLYYYLISKINDIAKMFRGAGIKHLNKRELFKLNINLIDKKEQKIIVKNLDKINNVIELKKKQLNELDIIIKSQFVEMFDNKGFKKEKLKNNIIEMFIGPFGSALKNEYFVEKENGYSVVYEQKHAINKNIKEFRWVDENKYKSLERFNVKPGDIIVSCRGTVGKTYIIPDDAPIGIMHPSIMKIRVKKEKYIPKFFEKVLEEYLEDKERETTGAIIKMGIKASQLEKEYFIIPDLVAQTKYLNIVKQIDKQKFESMIQLKMMEKIYNIINDRRRYV